MEDIICLAALIWSNSVLFSSWFLVRQRKDSRIIMIHVWLFLLVLLGFIGYRLSGTNRVVKYVPKLWCSCTDVGSAITVSSYIWLTGPVLLWTVRTKLNACFSLAACILLPWLSGILGFLVAFCTGQVLWD